MIKGKVTYCLQDDNYLISRFYLETPVGLWTLFLYCFLLVVPGDIVLCVLGAVLGKRMIPVIRAGRGW